MWPQEEPPTCQAISKSIERLTARLSKLKKQHSTAKKDEIISEFHQQEYVLPKLGFYKGRVLHFSLASFPGSSAWAERKEPGTHCLRMLSSPRISGNLEISVKSAPLHQPPQGMPTSPA